MVRGTYERNKTCCCLAKGYKLPILVSPNAFRAECQPHGLLLGLQSKKLKETHYHTVGSLD